MATPRSRRAAQRATARAVRENRRQLPSRITNPARRANEQYARDVLAGREPRPEYKSLEGHGLARWASFSKYSKADPAYLKAFQDYFYHDEKGKAAGLPQSSEAEDEDG